MKTSELENALCDALESAGEAHIRTIDEVDLLTTALTRPSGNDQVALRLQQLAICTRETEARVAPLQKAWAIEKRQAGPRLRQIMSRQQSTLQKLIQRIETVEQSTREARSRLMPRVDAIARSHEMRSAYARTVHQASE